jgi:hypothetical protein
MNDIQDAEQNLNLIQNPKEKKQVKQETRVSRSDKNFGEQVLPETVREKSRQKIKQLLNKKKGLEKSKNPYITNLTDLIKAHTSQEVGLGDKDPEDGTENMGLKRKTVELNQVEHSRVIRESFKLSMLDSQMIRKSRDVRLSIKALKPNVSLHHNQSKQVANHETLEETPDTSKLKIHKEEIPGFKELQLERSKMMDTRGSMLEKELRSLRSLETLGSMYQSLNTGYHIGDRPVGLSRNYVDSHLIVKNSHADQNNLKNEKPEFQKKRPNTPRYAKKSAKEGNNPPQYKTLINQKKRNKMEENKGKATKVRSQVKSKTHQDSVFDSKFSEKVSQGSNKFPKKQKKSSNFGVKSQEKGSQRQSLNCKEQGLFRNFRKYMKNTSNRKITGSVKIDFKKN